MQLDALPQKPLMDLETFLEQYSLSRSQFYIEVNEKRLRVTKINPEKKGSKIFISREDAEEWRLKIRKDSAE